jgi:hypothetical protein
MFTPGCQGVAANSVALLFSIRGPGKRLFKICLIIRHNVVELHLAKRQIRQMIFLII